jgi:hemerythrin-like domain-containing protein
MVMSQPLAERTEGRDAVEFLMGEHRAVEALFARFEGLRGSNDGAAMKTLVADIATELRIHAEIEDAVFYPAVRKALAEGDELAGQSLHEHQEIEQGLAEIEQMSADDAHFEARAMTLINDVRHHVNEEESEILAKLRLSLGERTLQALGEELQTAKRARTSGRDASVLRELPFPDPETMDVATTAPTPPAAARPRKQAAPRPTQERAKRNPAATTRKSAAKKANAPKSPAKTARTAAGGQGDAVTYHVESADRGWKVLKEGAARASATFETKPDAVARGRELAKGQSRGRLIVHGKDGRVQNEFTYEGHPRRG